MTATIQTPRGLVGNKAAWDTADTAMATGGGLALAGPAAHVAGTQIHNDAAYNAMLKRYDEFNGRFSGMPGQSWRAEAATKAKADIPGLLRKMTLGKLLNRGGAAAGLTGVALGTGGLISRYMNPKQDAAPPKPAPTPKTAKFIRELNKVALVSPAPQQSAIKVAIARLKQGHSLESALRAAYPGKQGAMRISLGNRIKAAAETAPAAAPAPEAPKGLLSSPGAQAGVGTAAAVYLLKRFPAVRNAILSRVIPAAKEVAAPVATGLGVGGLVGYAPTISKHLFGETPQPTQQPFLGLATKSGADDGGMSYTPGLALGGAGMAGMLGADAISKPGLLETLGRTYQGVHNANQPPQPGLTGLVNKGKDLANTAMLHRHSHIKPMLRTLGKGTGVVGAGLLGIAGLTNALKGKPQQASDPLPPTQPTPKV